ncbi:sensor histidine kinase [Terrimonas alba]|uniref:sensor histidine kinase n=1 Tax=Terrimonas alba TaxID=3349636 RepID=UPI0035F2ACAA
MARPIFIGIILSFIMLSKASAQTSSQPGISTYSYHPSSEDKQSWQRLNLMLSSTFILVVKEGQVDLENCLIYASRSLGLSMVSVLAEGIDDPELLAQSQWIDSGDPGNGIYLLSKARGKKRLELLLLLGAYYAFQPQRDYHYRDSAEFFLAKAINESKTLKEEKLGRQALCLLGKIYVQGTDVQRGDSVFNRVIHESQARGDRETEARAFAYRGIYSPVSPMTAKNKLTYLQKAADIYHALNDTEGEINALTDIGYLWVLMGQLQNAHNVFLKALQLEEAIHYPYIHYNTDALAMVAMFEGKFGEPLKYTLQSVRTAENCRDSIGWAYFYSRMQLLYASEGGKENERRHYLQKALDRYIIDRNPDLYAILIDWITKLKDEGKTKEALDFTLNLFKKVPPVTVTNQFDFHSALFESYLNLNEFDLAEMHVSKMDSLETKAESIRGPLKRADIFRKYGQIHFRKGQYRQAKSYFDRYFLSASPATRNLTNDLLTYRYLIRTDSALGDDASAVAHYKLYTNLLDSNLSVTKVRQAEELQVMYQTKEKEDKITLLNQQAELEKANLKQATFTKNITIVGIIFTLIIAGLLYRQSRLRKRNNNVVTHKNEQLQHLLTEKEWLLKEIHHRVKNNLQIVMSLLNSQSAYIENDAALTAINDSQHRVHAMSLIHKKLYISENLSSINISVYIRELVSYLTESFDAGKRIRFEMCIEPLEMDVSQAVPLGLILNEAITNSIKYAFPDNRNGVVSISLVATGADHYSLIISDNGIGIHTDFKKAGSLGMSLMKGLSEDLDGNFSIENNNGTMIKISFVLVQAVTQQDLKVVSFALDN